MDILQDLRVSGVGWCVTLCAMDGKRCLRKCFRLRVVRRRIARRCMFFFFQAEDGIRDLTVTGVQTCALPISGPDAEILARPETFRPFYDKGAGLGQTTWPPDGWKHGGAPVWGWLSYDPALDLFYYGTGNPAPYNAEQRRGDNKWATSVLARRPGDGSQIGRAHV